MHNNIFSCLKFSFSKIKCISYSKDDDFRCIFFSAQKYISITKYALKMLYPENIINLL